MLKITEVRCSVLVKGWCLGSNIQIGISALRSSLRVSFEASCVFWHHIAATQTAAMRIATLVYHYLFPQDAAKGGRQKEFDYVFFYLFRRCA